MKNFATICGAGPFISSFWKEAVQTERNNPQANFIERERFLMKFSSNPKTKIPASRTKKPSRLSQVKGIIMPDGRYIRKR